jgi:hypothetical protein
MKRPPASFPLFAIALALIVAQAFFVALYVGHEREIYAWDHAMYYNMAREDFIFFGRKFSQGWVFFSESFTGNYNHIFALPSFVSFWLFGVSRLTFILTNFAVFFVAYEIGLAFLLRRALGMQWPKALIFSIVACCLTPPVWLALLEGYPDIGAAACILFAGGILFGDFKKPSLWPQAVLTGLILGCAVLLRRHFVYPAIALLLTAGLFMLHVALRVPARERKNALKRLALFSLICGAVFAATLAAIEPVFVANALTTDYTQLYDAYKRTPIFFMHFVLSIFGIGLLIIGVAGIGLLICMPGKPRIFGIFVSMFTLIWLIVWCAGPAEAAHHYMLHAVPLFVIAGMEGWFLYLAQNPTAKKYIIGGLLFVALAANSARALWFSPVTMWPQDEYPISIMSAPRPPIVRPDYNEWLRLATYLRMTTTPDDHIEVIGSSIAFSLGILYGVYADILGTPSMYPRLMEAPEIDHISSPPLNIFSLSDIYVVAVPTQYHLGPSGQKVVTAAAAQFPPPPSRAAYFHRDDAVFHMADGITVYIWRRKNLPPQQLHEALADIRRISAADAKFDLDWIATSMPLELEDGTDKQNHTAVDVMFSREQNLLGLLFDYPLAPGAYHLAFTMVANNFCPQPQFRLTPMTADGRTLPAEDFAPIAAPGETSRSFSLPAGKQYYFVKFEVRSAAAAPCQLKLRDLRVEQAGKAP